MALVWFDVRIIELPSICHWPTAVSLDVLVVYLQSNEFKINI